MNETPASDWKNAYQHHLMGVFGTPPAQLVRGRGLEVWDVDGKRYLDFLAGIAVNALGHAHPALVRAVTEQAGKLIHISNLFASEPQIALAAKLTEITGAGADGRVFFCNSGTEANEAAFKLARRHALTLQQAGQPERRWILSLTHSFHGRTMGALAMTAKEAIQAPFRPLPDYVRHVEPTAEALTEAIDDTVAAVILEPIQGEAGVLPIPDETIRLVRELTASHGALMIVDEVQTGVGRTGDWFGFQRSGVTPDAITLAKGLGGGVPIGALVTYGFASSIFRPGDHGSTFGGNPLATAAGLAVLGEIERADLMANVRTQSERLRVGLEAIPGVAGVRGRGLLLGVALDRPVAAQLVSACLELGAIVNAPGPDTIRLAPPLIVGAAEVDEFLEIFARALAQV